MRAWRGLQVALAVGSVYMILLIIVYWGNVGGGFNLYPLQQDPRRDSVVPEDVREERREVKREEEREDTEEKGQEERKRRIMDVCEAGEDSLNFPGKSRTFEHIPNSELDNLIIDDTNQIIYCYVPKVLLFTLLITLLIWLDPVLTLLAAILFNI